ncbi:tripartite tricarboxylate transporter TctB family protein [Terrihabitans sp. B22-R8]|uniref:tripartite tricarboxylate transporter TctB family protein n=1 Tax=Terrihabitans sp. B22-R8 TaxID=3425128 RepID=UPI00403C0270
MEISRRTGEIGGSIVTGLLGALVCYGATENGIQWDSSGPQPGYFPFYIGCLIIVGSLGALVQTLLSRKDGEVPFVDAERARNVVMFFLPIIAFAALSVWLGLYIGIFIYIFYTMWIPGKMQVHNALLTAIIVVAVNYILFEVLFTVPLLKGPVLNALGIY